MLVFYLFLVAHLIADFPLQTFHLVDLKRKRVSGIIIHCVIITLTLALLLFPLSLGEFLAVLTVGVAHFFIDKLSVLLHQKKPVGTLYLFVFDQALHFTSLGIIASFLLPSLNSSQPIFSLLKNEKLLIYLAGYLLVTYAGAIFTFEAKRTFAPNSPDGNACLLLPSWGKYLAMIERAAIVTLIILSQYTFVGYFVLGIVIAAKIVFILRAKDRAETVEFISNYLLAIITGILMIIL